ncbi:unnamed protein product, partial [marine sediment metagenome]
SFNIDFSFVRRKKLTDRFSIIWVIVSLFLFIGSIWRDLFVFINKIILLPNTITTIFLLGILFLIYLNLFFTIEVSKLQKNLTTIAQKFAILTKKVEEILSTNEEEKVEKHYLEE